MLSFWDKTFCTKCCGIRTPCRPRQKRTSSESCICIFRSSKFVNEFTCTKHDTSLSGHSHKSSLPCMPLQKRPHPQEDQAKSLLLTLAVAPPSTHCGGPKIPVYTSVYCANADFWMPVRSSLKLPRTPAQHKQASLAVSQNLESSVRAASGELQRAEAPGQGHRRAHWRRRTSGDQR